MGSEKLIRISFREMREMFKEAAADCSDIFFMTRGLAIGRGVNGVLRGILDSPAPFFVEEGRLLLLKKGEAEATINLMNYKFSAGTLLYVGSGSIVQVKRASPDVQLSGIMFSDEMLALAVGEDIPASFRGQELAFRVAVNETETGVIDRMIQTVWDVAHQSQYSKHVVMAQLKALLHYCDWLRQRDSQAAVGTQIRERELFEQFISLVNANCRNERRLSFYADRMCVSERYLGTMVRMASGITAKEWIDKAAVTAAKVMLCHTDKPVNRIADDLNFATDSFFCKYFRRLTGISPRAYRAGFAAGKNRASAP